MKKIKTTLKYIVVCLLITLSFVGCAIGQNTANNSTTAAIEAQADTQNVDEQDIVETGNTAATNSEAQDITENSDTQDKDSQPDAQSENGLLRAIQKGTSVSLTDIPVYGGTPYIQLENNIPDFTDEEKKCTEAFEQYSDLDPLGRCGQAYANICPELRPTEPRGEIGDVRPSGWHTVKYNDLIDGNYLYNRCHLIAYCLAGENANEKNLITGTRYLNIEGMLPFEEIVNDYVDETGNHVLYRVTPIFEGDNLVASGVEMAGWSVEDEGAGICFHVYCYNVQPGIRIDYADGTSWQSTVDDSSSQNETAQTYILNTDTKKIHRPTCSSVGQMNEKNKKNYEGTVQELENMGYTPCKKCNP